MRCSCRAKLAIGVLLLVQTAATYETMTSLKKKLTKIYDPLTRPTLWKAENDAITSGTTVKTPKATNVETQFSVQNLIINQKSRTFTLEGYFRAWWTDERLKFDNESTGVQMLIFGQDWKDIWTPDFYFEQSIDVEMGDQTKNTLGNQLNVEPSGEIFWSRQATVELRCKMRFDNIPYDSQVCAYHLGLYSNSADMANLTWKSGKDLQTGKDLQALENWDSKSTSTWRTVGLVQVNRLVKFAGVEEKYTHVIAYLSVDRIHEEYVQSFMTLSILFVLMSYAGFWINPAAVPARVALGVITVLVVSGLRTALKNQLPPFSYSAWLTDFMFFSMLFNIAGFFCLAIVNTAITVDTKMTAKEKAAKAKAKELRALSSDPVVRQAKEAFDKIDIDESGTLDRNELEQALTAMKKSPDEITALMAMISQDELTFQQFLGMLKSNKAKAASKQDAGRLVQYASTDDTDPLSGEPKIVGDTGDLDDPPERELSLSYFHEERSMAKRLQYRCRSAIRGLRKLDYTMRWAFLAAYLVFLLIMVIKISLAPDVPEDIKLAQYYQTGWKDLKQG